MSMWDTAWDAAPLVLAPSAWTCMYLQYKYAGAYAYGVPVWLVVAGGGGLVAIGASVARLALSPEGRGETVLALTVAAGLLLELMPVLLSYLLPRRYRY